MFSKKLATGLTALSVLSLQVHAKSININPLVPGLNSSYLGVEDASLADQAFSKRRTPGRMTLYSTYHFDNQPWILMSENRQKEVATVVSNLHTIELGFSWLLGDNMQVGAQTFGAVVGVAPQFGGESNVHAGDTRLQFKYRFLTDTYWNMAIAPELTIPTGVEYIGNYLGASLSNSSFAPGVKMIGEYRTSENQWTFNLGYTYYDQAEYKSATSNYPKIDGRSRLFIGTGWLMRLNRHWAFDSEFSSQTPMGTNHFTQPGLMTLGARYQPNRTVSWNFGAGTGAFGPTGGNSPVVYLGIKVPFFGSEKELNNPATDEDPLVQEAYRKNLVDYADENNKVSSNELAPLMNTNPIDQDTGKPLYSHLDELTKNSDLKKSQRKKPSIESDRFK